MLQCSRRAVAGSCRCERRDGTNTPFTEPLPRLFTRAARPSEAASGNSLNTTEPQTLGGGRARQQGAEPGRRPSSPRPGPSPGCQGARTTQATAPGRGTPQMPTPGTRRESNEASRLWGWSRAAWAPLAQTAAPRLRPSPQTPLAIRLSSQ